MKKVKVLIMGTLLIAFLGCQNVTVDSGADEEIFTGYVTEENQDEQFRKALEELETRGNIGSPDHHLEGTLWEVKPNGSSRKLTYSQAVTLARQYNWIDTNGSGCSLANAKKGAVAKAKVTGSATVLVYIAQGFDYWNANDEKFKSVYRSLVADATKNRHAIKVTSHSWSGHIVADIVRDNTLVTHIAYNPAHGNFKKGETVADYVYDLKNMKAKTIILTGSNDPVTTHGGGSAYKVWWGIKGYNSVYYAVKNNPKVTLHVIKRAGHGIEDMLNRGAGVIANRY